MFSLASLCFALSELRRVNLLIRLLALAQLNGIARVLVFRLLLGRSFALLLLVLLVGGLGLDGEVADFH